MTGHLKIFSGVADRRADRLEVLVEPLPGLVSVTALPDLSALVLGWLADGRLAGVL